jgi:hypothetical protein
MRGTRQDAHIKRHRVRLVYGGVTRWLASSPLELRDGKVVALDDEQQLVAWSAGFGMRFEDWTVNADIDAVAHWCEHDGEPPGTEVLWDTSSFLVQVALQADLGRELLPANEDPTSSWDVIAFARHVEAPQPTAADYAAVRHMLRVSLALVLPHLDHMLAR